MTPERAHELAEENGCKFFPAGLTCNYYVVERNEDNYGYITKHELEKCSEEKFIAFYIPDKRD